MINIIVKETKEFIADKKIWIGFLTVLIIFIIGTSYNTQKTKTVPSDLLRLGVINKDESAYSSLLLDYFTGSSTFTSLVSVITGDEKEITEAFDRGELDIYLEIPKDFASNMIHLENSPVKVTINTSDTTKAILFENVLKSYEKYISGVEANAVGLYDIMEQEGRDQKQIDDTNRKISIDLIFTALGKEAFFSFHPVKLFPATTLIIYYMGAFLVMVLLYFGLYAGYQLLREMKQGTFTRLRTTRTSLYQFLLAKTAIISVVLAAFVLGAVTLLNRKPMNAASLFFSLSAALFCVCLAVFLCALFPIVQRFILAGNLLIFCFTILGGGIIPIQFLPQDLITIAKVSPFYYILKGILQLHQRQDFAVSRITFSFFLISAFLLITAVILLQKRSVISDEV